jgi:hypothetical protein
MTIGQGLVEDKFLPEDAVSPMMFPLFMPGLPGMSLVRFVASES